jgi:hypothetical protein
MTTGDEAWLTSRSVERIPLEILSEVGRVDGWFDTGEVFAEVVDVHLSELVGMRQLVVSQVGSLPTTHLFLRNVHQMILRKLSDDLH